MLRKSKSRQRADGPGGSPDGASGRAALVERVAGWSVRHRALAIAGWFALVVVAVLASAVMPGDTADSTDPGETGRAGQVLDAQQKYPAPQENVLVQARAQDAARPFTESPELRRATQDLVTTLRRTPGTVTAVRSPLERDGSRLVSKDGRSGLVTFTMAGAQKQWSEHYNAATTAVKTVQARHPQVRLAQAGDRSLSRVVDEGIKGDFKRAEFFSLPLTVVILLVVFGSLIAAAIPLLLAATTVVATFGFLQVLAHWVPVNSATSSMVLLIGVAVGVDYSLFYLRRAREERAAGHDVAEALRITARTSGRVVVVSGLTVMLCLVGLLFTGLDNFKGLTTGAVLVVGVAMVGSVTVLPALLAALGHRVDKARIPWVGRRRTAADQSRAWAAVARAVVRRPLVWGGSAALALLVLALPALGMRLQDAAVTDSLSRKVPTVDAAVRMQEAFPGAPSPASVVIWGKRDPGAVDSPAVRRAVESLHQRAAASGGALNEPISATKVGRALVVRVPLASFGTDDAANRALETLRKRTLPAALGEAGGADGKTDGGIDYAVAGKTAFAYDFTNRITDRTPYVFAFVLLLAFVLLVVAFRSPAVALMSIVLNLLSIGAAYGVLTWVFQDGHLSSALDFTSYGGVVGWLPLFMFVILFGLSMDYHIFVLSRIRERRLAGEATREAVVGGVASGAGVVTSAAVIMTAAFSVFVVLSAIEYKMMGVGLAVAVLIDATLVRGVLLPAAITLLGRRSFPQTSLQTSLQGRDRLARHMLVDDRAAEVDHLPAP
ncbi:MMPL domain-containing protein [Streptomyces bingchenggensis BCW-1]|uniref:MMPL domain-containing protein n=1 Tax=Streptomyces bingchenggensis (strain BCW-1) TaxID=749414 RepID=D7BR55_STRBB|nr:MULTISPECIES: MMPL family transporter [Streptomyces]ADI11405.1 MMPL domain-containing protein [Streptomyces bingchenggensis BCW-1]